MADDPDPPRKLYQLKPKEFERVNAINSSSPADTPAAPDPGPAAITPPEQRIDVHELIRQGAAGAPVLGVNVPSPRNNEVHAVLKERYEHDKAAGLYYVEPTVDKQRRRRIINYWVTLVLVDVPFAMVAIAMGPGAAIPFVCAIAGIGMFTAWWTWHNWFLRTER